jgi:lipid-A-disaccharide synthase
MKRLLSVKHVSLPNIIVDRTIIPEQLLHECTPDLVGEQLTLIMPDAAPERQAMLQGYDEMRQRLGTAHAADRTAQLLIEDLQS